jgi:hypothetical protein
MDGHHRDEAYVADSQKGVGLSDRGWWLVHPCSSKDPGRFGASSRSRARGGIRYCIINLNPQLIPLAEGNKLGRSQSKPKKKGTGTGKTRRESS